MFGGGRQSATTEAIGFLCVRVYALYFRFRNVFFNQFSILAQKIFAFLSRDHFLCHSIACDLLAPLNHYSGWKIPAGSEGIRLIKTFDRVI